MMSSNKNCYNLYSTKSTDCDDNIEKCENEMKCNNGSIQPKKPYLRKGAGLARYGLKLEEINKKTKKLKFYKPIRSVPSKIKVPRKCLNQVQKFPKIEFGKVILEFFLFNIKLIVLCI